jgi:O-antigen ligase
MIYFLIIAAHVGLYSGAFQLFSVGSLAVQVSDLAMMVFIVAVGFRLLWYGEPIYLSNHPAFIFLCGSLVSVILSGLAPLLEGDPAAITQYFKTTGHFLYLWLFTFLCSVIRFDIRALTDVIKVTIFVSLFINIFGAYQVPARAFDWPFAWLELTNISIGGRSANVSGEMGQLSLRFGDFFRATSVFSEPSALAGFCATVLTYMLMPFALGQRPFIRSSTFMIFAFIAMLTAMFLTFSLTGLLTGSLIVLAAVIFGQKERILRIISVLAVSIFVIIIVDAVVSSYAGISVANLFEERVTGILSGGKSVEGMSGESFFTRWESIFIAFQIWTDYPLTGKGLGLYAYADQAIKLGYGFPDSTLAASLAELGIIGFICILNLNIFLLFQTLKLLTNKKIMDRLRPEIKRLFTIIPFILIITTAGTTVGNSLVNLWMWLSLAFCFPVYNAVLSEAGYKFIPFKIIQIPLSQRVRSILQFPKNAHPAV